MLEVWCHTIYPFYLDNIYKSKQSFYTPKLPKEKRKKFRDYAKTIHSSGGAISFLKWGSNY